MPGQQLACPGIRFLYNPLGAVYGSRDIIFDIDVGESDMSRWIGNLILSLLSIVFALVVAEGVLRWFPQLFPSVTHQFRQDAEPDQMGVSHLYIGHLHTPNNALVIPNRDFQAVHHTDGHGFRNAWPWPETADIVFVGDSLTFGYGVEDDESWPAIIGAALPQLRVINLGLIGASPEQYVRIYETFGVPLQPKLLVVGLFPGNDFWDAGLYAKWLSDGVGDNYMAWRDYGRPLKSAGRGKALERFLKQHVALYHVYRQARRTYRDWRTGEPKSLKLSKGGQLQLSPRQLKALTVGTRPERPEFRYVIESLTRLKSLAAKHKTHVVLVIQPDKEFIYLPLIGETAVDAAAHLRPEIERLKYAYVDTTPLFQQQAEAGEQLFFETDGHPNAEGYRLIAQAVLAHVQQHATAYGLQPVPEPAGNTQGTGQ